MKFSQRTKKVWDTTAFCVILCILSRCCLVCFFWMLEQAGMSKLLIPKLHSCTWKHGEILAPLAALHKNSRWWQAGRGSSNWQFGAFSQPDVHMKLSSHVFSDRVEGHKSFQKIVSNTSQCTFHHGSASGVAVLHLDPAKSVSTYLLMKNVKILWFRISPHQLTCQQVGSGIGSERSGSLGKEWNVWWNCGLAAVLKMMRRRKRRRRHHDNQNDENYNHNS